MNTGDDDDIKLQRASALLLSDLEHLIPRLLRKNARNSGSAQLRHQIRPADMYRATILIESFQEDPQLLDTHLKSLIPPLVAAYLETLHTTSKEKLKKGFMPLSHAICQILNLFCKVRGEKVIKGFLNNEPRFLELILNEFEIGKNFLKEDNEPLPQFIIPWTERYVLILWLSHLMLAPFPLASMSGIQSSDEVSTELKIELPAELPGITLRVLTICMKALQSASKERGAAANLLVRLCVRPDMQKIGLLKTLVKWSLAYFSTLSEDQADIHQCLGVLSFLSGLVTSATNEEIGPFLPAIYQCCQNILNESSLTFVKSSAVARKLIIKTLRNIAIHCLQATSSTSGLEPTMVIEDTIGFLLEALADGDTPVRYAASKALSIVAMKLDPEMAGEVVEAILGSLNENVYWQGSKRNLSGVNPLQWHGLTLTLSHLLYRRAISTTQLPEILNALLLALAFEQRSATGGSIGTNVRDAACFGIWALSRRYSTNDLLAVETSSIRASEHQKGLSITQVLAIELLVVACLDPAGNIRRGSSAALQELIGRHPDTVEQGIQLVQAVDFHAVGLRERAMCKVAPNAGGLSPMYWEALFENLLGWRGTGSLDSPSRLFAAAAVGLLSKSQTPSVIHRMAEEVCSKLGALRPREVEERQGLVSALSALIGASIPPGSQKSISTQNLVDLTHLWGLLNDSLHLEDKSFTNPALRPELTASSFCNFLGAMAGMSLHHQTRGNPAEVPTGELIRVLNLCLGRHEDSILEAIPKSSSVVLKLLQTISPEEKSSLITGWLDKLENEASYNGRRYSGFAIALGTAYRFSGDSSTDTNITQPNSEQYRIVKLLAFRCTSSVSIEARTVALQAFSVLLKNQDTFGGSDPQLPEIEHRVADALHTALNDYTVTERGDVGALVRLEALGTVGSAWEIDIFRSTTSEPGQKIYTDVLRLSLEKLDKIRARAAQVLGKLGQGHFVESDSIGMDTVSTYAYFANALRMCQKSTPSAVVEAICLGFAGSAGAGSESVVQNSRAALLDTIDAAPVSSSPDEEGFSSLDIANCLMSILKSNLDNERVLLPLLEVLAFLFDMQVMHQLIPTSFNFRTLLAYIQKAHFKSTHMQKLHLSLDVYRGLGTIPSTRKDTITKVTSMLLHPFPNIRISAAGALWILTQEESLKRQDWSLPSKNLKPVVEGIKANLTTVI